MALGQRCLTLVRLMPGQGISEGQKDGRLWKTLLEGSHDFAPTTADLRRVEPPGLCFPIPLFAIIEQQAFVLFNIKQDTSALPLPRHPRRQAGVVDDGGVVIAPIPLCRRGVEPKKIVDETAEGRSLEIGQ